MGIEIVFGIFISIALMVATSIHSVDEGFVAIYFRGGSLLTTINEPGWHVMIPFLTRYEQVQVTVQTDKVNDVPCGTAGGVMINFGQIEVVNRLRKDLALETVRNYTVEYDKTWIYDKIQ